MLKDQGKIFAGPEVMVQGFVTETPRFSYPSGWNVEMLLVYFFDVFTAYWLNKLFVLVIGFASMYCFLKNEIQEEADIYVVMSLLWATLAFYPHRGISIAALPLVFTVFRHFREGAYFERGLILIICYSLYSMFVLAGLYIWIIFSVIACYWMIKDKKWNRYLITGLTVWMATYVVVDYQLFYAFLLQNDFVSHRTEMIYKISIWSEMYPWDFLTGRDHAGVFYWPGYFWLALAFSALQVVKSKKRNHLLLFFASLAGTIAVGCSMISQFSWMDGAGTVFSFLHSLNLLRFSFFLPFALFAVVVIGLAQADFIGKKWLILFFIAINVFIYQYEWRNLINEKISVLPYRVPGYREYFAVEQYDKIKQYLGDKAYSATFGHINLPPAVSAYNRLQAVDGYLQNYSLAYKHRIRSVIDGELQKDPMLASHFDNWGNKCYLQNASYPDMFDLYHWKNTDPIRELKFDFSKLKHGLKVEYLLSSVAIEDRHLELVKLFMHQDSAWDIYLYSINAVKN